MKNNNINIKYILIIIYMNTKLIQEFEKLQKIILIEN
jgi:hypothetical protein